MFAMRILFVSTHINPLNSPDCGDAQRTQLLLRACTRVADVDLITFAGKSESMMDGVKVVYDKCIKIYEPKQGRLAKWARVLPVTGQKFLFPVNKKIESIVDEIIRLGDYDLIVSRYFHRTLLCGLWKYYEKLIVDFDDSPSSFFISQITESSSLSMKIRMHLAAKKAERISRKAIGKMRAAFFANPSHARAYKASYLPNIPYYESSCSQADFNTQNRRIVFVGQLDYMPNRNGLDHFFEKIYPSLYSKIFGLEFHIIGLLRDKDVRDRWESYPGVVIRGFVDDLQKEYEEAHVVVVPVYQCGGTNIKLLEAMKMNRACVTTKAVIEKMDWNLDNGRAFYAADNDEEFVDYVVELLRNDQLNIKMAGNGKSEIERNYSFDAFCRRVVLAIK